MYLMRQKLKQGLKEIEPFKPDGTVDFDKLLKFTYYYNMSNMRMAKNDRDYVLSKAAESGCATPNEYLLKLLCNHPYAFDGDADDGYVFSRHSADNYDNFATLNINRVVKAALLRYMARNKLKTFTEGVLTLINEDG